MLAPERGLCFQSSELMYFYSYNALSSCYEGKYDNEKSLSFWRADTSLFKGKLVLVFADKTGSFILEEGCYSVRLN